MVTPTMLAPSAPLQPDEISMVDPTLIRLVNAIAESIQDKNPNIRSAFVKFKQAFFKELEDLSTPKDSLPAARSQPIVPQESPNKPLG